MKKAAQILTLLRLNFVRKYWLFSTVSGSKKNIDKVKNYIADTQDSLIILHTMLIKSCDSWPPHVLFLDV